jgi:cytoskeletal protein CcmA (bactofilin family)
MKRTWKILSLLAALFVCLALVAGAQAAPARPGEMLQQCGPLILGGACTLQEGETMPSDMLVMGGVVTLEEGSTVEGDLAVFGGTVYANGLVEGDLAAIGGSLFVEGTVEGDLQVVGGMASLGEEAVVEGDVETVAGALQQADGATIEGEVRSAPVGPLSLVVPGQLWLPNWDERQENNQPVPPVFNFNRASSASIPPAIRFNPFMGILWWLGRAFIWAVLALLVALLLPRNAVRTGQAAVAKPALAGGLGCLTMLVAPIILLLLVITVCGIPFAMLGGFVLSVAWAFGIIALGVEIGQRMAASTRQDWALPVSAALGTLALTLVTNGVGALVPCVGWMLPVLVGLVGLGAVLLTRFGAQVFPENGAPPASYSTDPLEPLPAASVSDLPVEPLPPAPAPEAPASPPVTQVIDLEE